MPLTDHTSWPMTRRARILGGSAPEAHGPHAAPAVPPGWPGPLGASSHGPASPGCSRPSLIWEIQSLNLPNLHGFRTYVSQRPVVRGWPAGLHSQGRAWPARVAAVPEF